MAFVTVAVPVLVVVVDTDVDVVTVDTAVEVTVSVEVDVPEVAQELSTIIATIKKLKPNQMTLFFNFFLPFE